MKKTTTRNYVVASLLVLVASLFVTIGSWYTGMERIQTEEKILFEEQAESLTNTVSARLDGYAQILTGAVALVNISDSISRDEWNRFVELFELNKNFRGTLGVGYAEYISNSELESHTAIQRLQNTPDYSVFPAGQREVYVPAVFIVRTDNIQITGIGFDMFSETNRRNAMIHARDSGEVIMTDGLALLQNGVPVDDTGFIVYKAVYGKKILPLSVEERRSSVTGFVFVSLRAKDLFDGVLAQSPLKDTNFRVSDNTHNGNDILYESTGYAEASKQPDVRIIEDEIESDGRKWKFNFVTTKTFVSNTKRLQPYIVLVAGTGISIFLAWSLFFLLRNRAKHLQYAKQQEVQEAKDDLVSLASHQLRTPATGVKQYVGMVLQGFAGSINPKTKMLLERAYESNERQIETIDQILNIAKADAGRLKIEPTLFDIRALIMDTVAAQQNSIKEHNHVLKLKLPKKPVLIRADERYIRMVMENLLSNATKYTHPNGTLRLELTERATYIILRVKDSGVGITADDQKQLFKKFSRIDNDLSVQAGGSGVGLYLANRIVEDHKGSISVRSGRGKGSTFEVKLPKKL